MTKKIHVILLTAIFSTISLVGRAQYVEGAPSGNYEDPDKVVLTLEDALKIALSENVSVKVADMEIERSEYAKKGTYASLFPQVSGSGSYQRTIKKQVMYMGGDDDEEGGGGMASMFTSALAPLYNAVAQMAAQMGIDFDPTASGGQSQMSGGDGGIEVGRWNTFNAGINASMPLVNVQLWKSLEISGLSVDLAVEQARSSRLDMVTQVKQAFYAVLLAKDAFEVYKSVYENAVDNLGQTEKKYKAEKASELDYTRAKVNVANAIPNVYQAESQVMLALWQLKAIMGVDLDMNIDVAGSLMDYSDQMFRSIMEGGDAELDHNTTMRQLALQAEQLAETIKLQKYAMLPSLSLGFAYSYNAMTNDFKFSEYKWTPYSYIGLSLSIPIFSGGKNIYNVRTAKIQAQELDLQRINTERQLKIAIRQYLNTMEANMKSYDSAKEAVDMAQKAYDISAKSYNLGKSTLTDLNDAQLALTQSKLAQTQAVYNFMVAKSNLEQTLGDDFLDGNGNVDLENM